MSSKYIDNGSYAVSGYTLSSAITSLTIGPNGTIGGPGIVGSEHETDTVVNRGCVTGSLDGIYLQDGGSVTNGGTAAFIGGYDGVQIVNGFGSIANTGTIESDGSLGVGVLLADGGIVSNGTYGVISGIYAVDARGSVATIINKGEILSTAKIGVRIAVGGTVLNYGGIFSDGSIGLSQSSGTVINQGYIDAKGTNGCGVIIGSDNPANSITSTLVNYGPIIGAMDGIVATNAYIENKPEVYHQPDIYGKYDGAVLDNVTLVNDFQHIAGETGMGIVASGNCVIENGTLGSIYGRMGGIEATGHLTIVNRGGIGASGIDATKPVSAISGAVDLVLTNRAIVSGYDNGIDLAAGTHAFIDNYSQIYGDVESGIALGGVGTISNAVNTRIFGRTYGVESFGGLSITNSGLIWTGGARSPAPTAGYYGGAAIYIHPGGSASFINNGPSGDIYGIFGIVGQSAVSIVNAGIMGVALSASPGAKPVNSAVDPTPANGSAPFDGAAIVLGGSALSSVANASTGTINGGHGIQIIGPATIVNAGTILGTLSTGIDIASYAMAGIDNQLGGTIVGASFGIEFASEAIGTVTNSGLISGGQTGVYLDNKVGAIGISNATGSGIRGVNSGVASAAGVTTTVSNAGTIAASGMASIGVQIGGYLLNEAGAQIVGATGVSLASGTVTNFGTIASLSGTSGISISLRSNHDVLVDQAGSAFIGKVMGGGGTLELAEMTGTLSSLGTSFTGFGTIDLLSGASWSFAGIDTVTAKTSFAIAAGGTLGIASGTLLTVAVGGTLGIAGTVSGAGTLRLSGSETLYSGASLAMADLVITGGDAALTSYINYAGACRESGGTVCLAGHSLNLTGAASFDGGTVTGTGHLETRAGTSLVALTLDQGAIWQVFGTVTATGSLTLGDAGGGSGRLSIFAGGTVDFAANGGVAVAAGGSASIGNAGLIEKTGAGTSLIASNIGNNATIAVIAGTLDLAGSIGGSGSDRIGNAATLEFAGFVAATQTVSFAGDNARLLLTDVTAFQAAIAGFDSGTSRGDTIDVTTFGTGTTVTFTQPASGETVATLTNGGRTAKLTLFGQYSVAGFGYTASSSGTVISYTSPAQIVLVTPHH